MEDQRASFLETAQTLAAYVAIPVALVYPFGFFALFVQLAKYFFLDFYTAWYAASLVNRMVAIGQGAIVLTLALGASVLLSATVAQIFLNHAEVRGPGRIERRAVLYTLGLSLLILALYVASSRAMAGGRLSLFALRGRESTECAATVSARAKIRWQQLDLWPDSLLPASIFLAGCLLGGLVIYRSYRDYLRTEANEGRSPLRDYRLRPGFFYRGVTEGWIRSGLAIAYVFSVVASIVLAAYTPVYLPFITYGDTVEYRGGKEPTDKAFLSHTDGHWYFLHRLENDNDAHPRRWDPPDFKIVSLAEGKADHVRVNPNLPRASRVAPLPWGLAEPPLQLVNDPCEPKEGT